METRKRFAAGATASIFILFLGNNAFGQLGATAGQGQATRAIQLPLSGRSTQNGSVIVTESPVVGTTTSVDTISPTLQVQGLYTGSAAGKTSFSGELSLDDAVQRALKYNLGIAGVFHAVSQARGASRVARSALLPNLNGNLSETVEQANFEAFGLRFHFPGPGVSIPTVVGPFNYFDLRASLSQSVMDVTAWNNYRSARENLRANEHSARDARELVVFATGGAYLQAIAAAARVQSARAQLETANALYQQTSQQHSVGLVAKIDVNRSHVQMLTQEQRLVALQNDLAKQKINLARILGLPPNDHYKLADDIPFAPASAMTVEGALQHAFAQRSDLKAAEAAVLAAERARSAARAEHLPSLSLSADYGAIGTTPDHSHGTFSVVGSLKFSIWQGGRIAGDIEQADAAVAQRKSELEDLRSEIEADVRKEYLDLEAAASQVEVARENIQVSEENLELTRQRFEAGVADNLAVVQSQESVAGAELDYINSVFAHNLAKLSLGRVEGKMLGKLAQLLNIQSQSKIINRNGH